ncbi:Ku protein [Niveispirillum sp. KHB5.9]|uniref:non-homologous end joining protein Ku n=1 Tax=Niveispirillum sp. KHB5.9 TaxID=3400269 RepID=UPI003A8A2033
MAGRHFWKGYLKLSLVTCRVAMVPVLSQAAKVRFHLLNRTTGNRVESRYVDSVTGKRVPEKDQVKAYEKGEDDHVLLEDKELDAVALESTRTIDIDLFAPRDSIDWVWYDTPYFLIPDDKVGEEAFAVIREAMRAADMAGIARLVLNRRERAVMLVPRDRAIMLWTLRYGDEVRDPDDYVQDMDGGKPDAKQQRLIRSIIDDAKRGWDKELAADPVQKKLLSMIAQRRRALKRQKQPSAKSRGDNVIDITDALKRSLKLG